MSTIEQGKQQQESKQAKHEMLNALIREQIIRTLGKPKDLLQVQIKLL